MSRRLNQVYTYDVAKAKELLAEAGYPDGFDLEITVPSSYSQHVDTAQIIADELSQAGVRTTIKQVGGVPGWRKFKNGQFQATVIGFDGTLAPGKMLQRYVSDDSKNFMHYSNAEFDRAFKEAHGAVDDAEKTAKYKKKPR